MIIWKVILGPEIMQEIITPAGAELLCVREQMEQVCLWFRCDPSAKKEIRQIIVVGTGWDDVPAGKHIGTAFLNGGQLVLHVFDGGVQ